MGMSKVTNQHSSKVVKGVSIISKLFY